MDYKEYIEEGTGLAPLTVSFINQKEYEIIHENTVILCHDVFIRTTYKGLSGMLLVRRLNEPVKGVYWPIGGRILRGTSAEESLKKKALEECSLTLSNITYLGVGRTFFKGEPFGHTKGTDTLNLVYVADGNGNLLLNTLHEDPLIVTRENYQNLRTSFVPYVQDFFDQIEKQNLW